MLSTRTRALRSHECSEQRRVWPALRRHGQPPRVGARDRQEHERNPSQMHGLGFDSKSAPVPFCLFLFCLREHLCPLRHLCVAVVGSKKVLPLRSVEGAHLVRCLFAVHMGQVWRADALIARLLRSCSARGAPGYWERRFALP